MTTAGGPAPSGPTRYDAIGIAYAANRREEPTWRAAIDGALAGARRVLNVGAGTGNYEPGGPEVVALEPSATMLAQRAGTAAPAVQGVAERLPFGDGAFDAALAVLTVHHWRDPLGGLDELARVADRQVVVTWDRDASRSFWLHRDYLPELVAHEAALSSLAAVSARLDVRAVMPLLVPRACRGGFLGAYWAEPGAYLDASVRASMSGLALLDPAAVERATAALADDLASGAWRRRNGELFDLDALDAGYRLVVAGGQALRHVEAVRPPT